MGIKNTHNRIVDRQVITAIENAIQHTVLEISSPKLHTELADTFWVKTAKGSYLIWVVRYDDNKDYKFVVYCIPEGCLLNSQFTTSAIVVI